MQIDTTSNSYTYASNPYYLIRMRTKDSGSDIDDTEYFNGEIDEFRISKIKRSSDWINTCYNTMTNTTTFVQFGSEQSQ